MNIKTVISIVVLISLALIAYAFLDIGKPVKTNIPIGTKVVDNKIVDYKGINNTEQITTKTSQLPRHIQPVEQISAEIVSFNEQLAKDLVLDYDDEFARTNAVRFLEHKQRHDSADVAEEINKYFENMVENQIEISDLIFKCKRAKIRFTEIEKKLTESNNITEPIFNRYYFFQGLLESNICNDLGTKRDPFFVFLNSARKGNMLSQLLLTDHLFSAIAVRKLINLTKYPLEYMDIRNEAVYYLKILASKGVTRASVRLSHLYSLDSYFLPRDRVWEYYYSFLAKKQEGFEVVYAEDPSELYDSLTDEQKIIVDRMTENL